MTDGNPEFPYSHPITVRTGDIDANGHLTSSHD
jgi:acyl-CoA thioesterase FadM